MSDISMKRNFCSEGNGSAGRSDVNMNGTTENFKNILKKLLRNISYYIKYELPGDMHGGR